jgi:hypothetical protein
MKILFLSIAASVALFGCAATQMSVTEAAPTCDAMKAHLIEVGCMQNAVCSALVSEAVETHITQRMPENAQFGAYCDIVLMAGILPVECIMEATTIQDVMNCGKKMAKLSSSTSDQMTLYSHQYALSLQFRSSVRPATAL